MSYLEQNGETSRFAEARREHAEQSNRAVDPALLSEAQAIIEASLVFASGLLTKMLYLDLLLRTDQPSLPFAGAAAVASILTYVVFRQCGMYEPQRYVERPLDLWGVGRTLTLVFLLVMALLFVLKSAEAFSRGWIAIWFTTSYGLLATTRAVASLYAGKLLAEGRLTKRVAIFGSGDFTTRIVNALLEHKRQFSIVGVFQDADPSETRSYVAQGGLSELVAFARAGHCDRIIVAIPHDAKNRINEILRELAVLPTEVQVCFDTLNIPFQISGTATVGPVNLLSVQQSPLNARGVVLKAIMDFALAAIALIAVAPVMFLIAIAIKLDTPGPIFFRQRRNGFNNRIIQVLKFRSMTVEENGTLVTQAQRNDPRVTRIGKFLRRTSLDELPQLINVLRGELSLVGPRPHAVAHNDYYSGIIDNYSARHKIKPGITGWAQVNGLRGETRDPMLMQKRVEFDLWYLNNWSPWLDIRILSRTLIVPFDRRVY